MAWREKGNVQIKLQEYEDALSAWNIAIRIKPDDYQILYLRGNLLMNYFLALNPKNPQLWMLKAQILAKMKQYQKARISALTALKLKPRDREIMGFIRSLSSPRR